MLALVNLFKLQGGCLQVSTPQSVAMLISSCYVLQEVTDLMGYLLRNRIIFIGSRIGDDVSVPTGRSLQSVLSTSMPLWWTRRVPA